MEVWGGNQAVDNGVVMPGLDAWVYSRPYRGDQAGGDIHYVSSCATGRITRILVADVSGHGSQVAQVAAGLRTLMRRFVNYVDQSRLVRGLNREFAGLDDQGRFATAVVATYWAPTDDLVVSNAGHPRPLWYRARERAWEFLSDEAGRGDGPVNIPLGIAEPTRYDERKIRLAAGDLVLLYTDSLIEARSPAGALLGEAGLLRLIGEVDTSRPERLIAALLGAVDAYTGGAPAGDDVTALLLRTNAFKPRASLRDGVATTLRMARELVASGGRRFPWPQATAANILGPFFGRFNRRGGGPFGRA
jgi:serine phosphatase RsbU (regulator of sigma subunit)